METAGVREKKNLTGLSGPFAFWHGVDAKMHDRVMQY